MATHFYHYHVHAEQRFFLGDERKLFDLVALNGNIVSHTPAGVAAFVATTNKPFYIDPQTHAFQHTTDNLKRDVSDKKKKEPPRFEFKPSIKALAVNHLSGPFAKVIARDQPLEPEDFLSPGGNVDAKVVSEVCEAVVNFQLNTLNNSLKPGDKEFIEQKFQPDFIIAPYFYFSPKDFERWTKINTACYQETVRLAAGDKVFFSLVISKEVLDLARDSVVEALSTIKPEGIILWIDDHVEEELSKGYIEYYINLLRSLRQLTGTLYNAHGGYLSVLLSHSELGGLLDGVGHSVNYGENRSVIPVGGGFPMARFYLQAVHSRLRPADALDIIRSMGWLESADVYRERVCKCQQCHELIERSDSVDTAFAVYGDSYVKKFSRRDGTQVSREYPTAAAKQAASRHYLYNKAKEFRDVEEKPVRELIDTLRQTFEVISRTRGGYEFISQLAKWHSVLSELND